MYNSFHINWTRPFFKKNPNSEYHIEDFELLTTILSALKWREKNGSIKMITDNTGYNYYKKYNLLSLWDAGVFNYLETVIPNYIDPYIFWAAGKMYALSNELTPCIMIDTDFIVWDSILSYFKNKEICVIHKEEVNNSTYPDYSYFKTKINLPYKKGINNPACNTAFAFLGNESFKKIYTDTAISFIENSPLADDNLTYMVFAEQRLLSLIAAEKNINISFLSDLPHLFSEAQTSFTHTWGYKQELKKNVIARTNFCNTCINRILTDFPFMKDTINNIPQIAQYIK